ncbi:hypothetical protein ACN20G_17675 [Streptomyces sp. BI20]|uniref:hypothetical protein n=1 Tax=Streptomyces sp. BI20 TaxID=3403460 RepID=UPI003C76AB3C
MNNSPTFGTPLPLRHLSDARPRLLTTPQLREHGVSTVEAAERGWQELLPGVHLLHSGTATSEDRLHAVLLYARRRRDDEAMITGLAALALYRFASAPALLALPQIDVLVPHTRRLRSTGCARVVRSHTPPLPRQVTGLPVAPPARAVADAVARLGDAATVRRLLGEAVRGGHCEPAALVRELTVARLLNRPHVVDAVESLLTEGRATAEDRLYDLVREFGLPDPVWNVDLRVAGGPHLGGVDAYWPDEAVALELDTRAPRQQPDEEWMEAARKREVLERLGITVVHVTPRKLREHAEQQATVLRTALAAAGDREPAGHVVVLPR